MSLVFGVVTMLSGLLGVPLGSWLGTSLVKRFPRAHPIICGAGLLVSAPAMTCVLLFADGNFYAPFILMFIAEVALNLNWAIVADMSLVRDAFRAPARHGTHRARATALEVFILFLVAFCLVFGGVLRMTCSMVLCSVFFVIASFSMN